MSTRELVVPAALSLAAACGSTVAAPPPASPTGHAGPAGPAGLAGLVAERRPTPPSTLERYPRELGAVASPVYTLTVNGQPVLVERYRDVSYARFAVAGEATLVIEASAPLQHARVIPSALVTMTLAGATLQLQLHAPANLVLQAEGLERLFLLADPVEHDRPVAGAPHVVSALDFGADPSGAALATASLQRALDAVAAMPGGGTLVLPPGRYRTGTLQLRSHVTLYLAAGATLQGSRDPADYPVDAGRHEQGSDPTIEPPDRRYLGQHMTFSRLLLIDGATDVHLRGRGTIDGDGSYLRKTFGAVPNLIRVRNSQRVTLEDVLLRDAAAWTVHLLKSSELALTNLKIINDRSNLNTDGIDPDSAQRVTIDRAFVYTKDDGIVIKATNNSDLLGDVAAIAVTNSVISSLDAALKLGSESQASQFRDITFDNIDIFDSGRAMSVVVRDGAEYRDVAFKNIRVAPWTDHLIEQVIGDRAGQAAGLGRITNLTFENIEAPSYVAPASSWTWYAQYRPTRPQPATAQVPVFEGADAAHAVTGLVLRNLRIGGVLLRDVATASQAANLGIGPFVDDVTVSATE